jgi:hypothetical protein
MKTYRIDFKQLAKLETTYKEKNLFDTWNVILNMVNGYVDGMTYNHIDSLVELGILVEDND